MYVAQRPLDLRCRQVSDERRLQELHRRSCNGAALAKLTCKSSILWSLQLSKPHSFLDHVARTVYVFLVQACVLQATPGTKPGKLVGLPVLLEAASYTEPLTPTQTWDEATACIVGLVSWLHMFEAVFAPRGLVVASPADIAFTSLRSQMFANFLDPGTVGSEEVAYVQALGPLGLSQLPSKRIYT